MRKLFLVLIALIPLVLRAQGIDLEAMRSRGDRYARLQPAARVDALGADLDYAGLHPETLPGGQYLVRFPGPHLGEDPDVLAVLLDWPTDQPSGAQAATALFELARALKSRHFRPRHGLWLLWANRGSEGMTRLILDQRKQGKGFAHLIVMEGGVDGIAVASQGRLVLEMRVPLGNPPPDPALLRSALKVPAEATATLGELPPAPGLGAGLRVGLEGGDATGQQLFEASLRAAAPAGAAFGVQQRFAPFTLPAGIAHPFAAWASAQAQRVLGSPLRIAPPRPGAMAPALSQAVPAITLGWSATEPDRSAELMRVLAEGLQDLP